MNKNDVKTYYALICNFQFWLNIRKLTYQIWGRISCGSVLYVFLLPETSLAQSFAGDRYQLTNCMSLYS
jgi:hypothetical protein